MRFTLPESTAYQQLVLLKDGVVVSAFNISANDTELTDGRVRVGLKVSNGSLGVTLIVESVGCQDNGRYEIVVKGDGVENKHSALVSVSGGLFFFLSFFLYFVTDLDKFENM